MPERTVEDAAADLADTLNQFNRGAVASAVLPLLEAVDFLLDRGIFENNADVHRAEQLRDKLRTVRASLSGG